MMPRLALLLIVLLAGPVMAQPAARWAAVEGPAPGPPRSIGGTSLGCLQGAVALPLDGPGWQVVRAARNRFWAHPETVAWLQRFAGAAQAEGFAALWIGDMSQPRGGPMPSGHASHQSGLDADIWLDLSPKPAVPAALRERIEVPSLVLADGSGVDPRRFTARHAALLRLVASQPRIDRVLVNPAIKRELCRMQGGAAWLRHVRPWWGHDSHMHVRLRCWPGSPECRDQAPPPAGDGCDASLEWWFTPEARRPTPGQPGPPPALPAACAGVLAAR